MAFVYDEDFSDPDYGIADITECDDVETLREWLAETRDRRSDIQAQIEAAKLTEQFSEDWMVRARGALAFASMGESRIKNRLKGLGHNPDFFTGESPEALQIKLTRQSQELARVKASAAFGRHLLDAMREALPQAAVDAITAEAATRAAGPLEEAA